MGLHSLPALSAQHGQLLKELNEERASALKRIAGMLESLIERLGDMRARIAHTEGDARAREIAAYRELRAHAARYRWYLEVQREALGIVRHDALDEFYRIPPPIEYIR